MKGEKKIENLALMISYINSSRAYTVDDDDDALLTRGEQMVGVVVRREDKILGEIPPTHKPRTLTPKICKLLN